MASCIVFLGFLAIPSALHSYDTSPSNYVVVPECIWAPATGGGTWVTELQMTAWASGVSVTAAFHYSGGYRIVSNLWVSPGMYTSVKFPNILSNLQSLDPSFTYYGKVGTLLLYTTSASLVFHAQAKTFNGNYGKTLPGLPLTPAGNSANLSPRCARQVK